MRCILEVSFDAEDFVLRRTLTVDLDVTITLEEAISTGNRAVPYVGSLATHSTSSRSPSKRIRQSRTSIRISG